MKYQNAVPVIATADVRSTVSYYTQVLGFAEHFMFGDPPVYAGVQRDGVLIYISKDEKLAATLDGSGLHPDVFLWVQDGAPDESGAIQIAQMNADGTGNTVLTHAPKPHSYAAWSPDGQYLAYVSEPGAEKGDLCIYDTLTGAHRVVLREEVFQELFRDARPSWEPKHADGK
jgi:Tol biopolymer transport system component